MKLNTYIITCDEAQYILPINIYMHKKYSNNTGDLICLGYSKPNYNFDDNIKFVSLKRKRDRSTWFLDLYNYFNTLDDEYLIFSVDDLPLINYINIEAFNYATSYLKNNKDVAVFYGTNISPGDIKGQVFHENDKYKLWNVNYNSHHITSLQKNIWNRKALLEVLKNTNSNLTYFEQRGIFYIKNNPKLKNYKCVGITVKNKNNECYKSCLIPTPAWSMCSSSIMGPNKISIIGIKNEDVKNLIKQYPYYSEYFIYSASKNFEIKYNVFLGDFNFNKLKNYFIENNVDFKSMGHGYTIKEWMNYYIDLHKDKYSN
mgnify:FL=1